MRRILTLTLLTSAACGLLSASALADEEESGPETPGPAGGYYLAGSVGGAFEQFGGFGGADIDPVVGGGMRLGARARDPGLFAVEVQYDWVGRFAIDRDSGTDHLREQLITANLRIYPRPARLEPYLIGGIGFAVANGAGETGTGLGARVGGGVQFYILRYLSVGVESSYVWTSAGVDDLDYVAVQGLITAHLPTE